MVRLTDDGGDGPVLLRWWPIIGVMIAWAVAGLLAFGSVKQDIRAVNTELAAHEKAQTETINRMSNDLAYIRQRVDQAIDKQK